MNFHSLQYKFRKLKIDFHHRRHNNSRNPRLIAGKTPNQRLLSLRVDPMNQYIINVDNFSQFSAESSESEESVYPNSQPLSRDHETRMLRPPIDELPAVDCISAETTELLQNNFPDKFSGTTQVEPGSSTKCWKNVMYQASLKAAMLSTGHKSEKANSAFSADLTKIVEGPAIPVSTVVEPCKSPSTYQPEWGMISEEGVEPEKENYVIPDHEFQGDITYSGILSCYDQPTKDDWMMRSSVFPNKYGEGTPFFMNDAW